MGAGVIILLTAALITVAALLLGAAAARRRWWLHCKVAAICCGLAAVQTVYLASTDDVIHLPLWVYAVGYLLAGFVLMTAWSLLRSVEKQRTGEETR